MVLLVIDAQVHLTNDRLYKFDLFVANLKTLINKARKNDVEVIFIRHDDGANSEMTKGKSGFEIYSEFEPLENEKIFDKKVNSPFIESGLLQYLKTKNEKAIVVAGLQTDLCIDASIKGAVEHGFNVVVPAYCNTTVKNDFMNEDESYKYYNEYIWKNRYGRCVSIDEAIWLFKVSSIKK